MIKETSNPSSINLHYLLELSFADPISVEDDSVWLEPSALVELYQHLPHHGGQLTDDLLTVGLNPHCSTVAARVGIHTCHKLQMCDRM